MGWEGHIPLDIFETMCMAATICSPTFFSLIALILTAGTMNDTFEVTFPQYLLYVPPTPPACEYGSGTKRSHNTVNSHF